MYPILNLHRHTQDLHWYLRSLEEVVIRALDNTSGGCWEQKARTSPVSQTVSAICSARFL